MGFRYNLRVMPKDGWRSYGEARAFVHGLGLLDCIEWAGYCRGDLAKLMGRRPEDIPAGPRAVYKDAGWTGWRDWLGSPPVDPAEPGYLQFKRARRFARSLRLQSAGEWSRWCAGTTAGRQPRPSNIPEHPKTMYPRAWRGWGDWLGTQRIRDHRYWPFDRARRWARLLGLRDARQWRDLCAGRIPDAPDVPTGIPATPGLVYRYSGWNGFGDWLGTGQVGSTMKVFMPFEDARVFVRQLDFDTTAEYYAWSAGHVEGMEPRPETIPGCPDVSYEGRGWTTWGDFLGTGNIHPTKREFVSFEEARSFARARALPRNREWFDWAAGRRADLGEFPIDVPKHPETVYADEGWLGWGDFLGNGNVAPTSREFRSFEEAREYARGLSLVNSSEWARVARDGLPDGTRLPDDVPHGPQSYYAGSGWAGWGDFLGTGNRRAADRDWLSFQEARELARELGLESAAQWKAFVHDSRGWDDPTVPDVPVAPNVLYGGQGWKGWCDFLGIARRARPRTAWRPFPEARAFARSLALPSSRAWEEWSRGHRPDMPPRPADIPGVPYVAYKHDGWSGWRDFLGTEPRRSSG